MNSDTFVEFSGSDGDVYSYDTFTLYFTNKNGDNWWKNREVSVTDGIFQRQP